MKNNRIGGVKKIAVLRALVLGDLIFALPALESLHHAYPEAEIFYLGRPWVKDFIQNRIPGISRVETFRPAPQDYEDLGFLIHPEDANDLFPRLQAEGLDIAISMQGGGRNSVPFLCRLKPRVAISMREEGALASDRWIPYDYYQNEVVRLLNLADLAGASPLNWTPHLPLLLSDMEAAAPFLQRIKRPFVVVHTGARDIRRCWPEKKFARTADLLKRRFGLEVVLTGTAVDEQKVQTVEALMEETAVNLNNQLSLPALTGLLANAALIVSNDTGVLHMGLAVGTRAVGLFWGEYISKSLPLSRDCFYPVIAWERRCSLCGMFLDQKELVRSGQTTCQHLVTFIDEITEEQVLDAVEKVLSTTV